MSEFIPNQKVLHYKILEEIGQGGMGIVYKAEDTKLNRTVALKFLAPNILATSDEKSRFIHEAQATAALHHPNICTIYEINEAEGRTFISMAHLEGETLTEKLSEGRLKSTEAARTALQIARGLKAAHEKGIVHRDIKSSNIMMSDDGRATIMDFGLAKSVQQTHVTQRGTKMGTIGYMSPEQARGDAVDHRTDLWSLGVLLYEMVTGRRPFRGDYDEAVIYSILNEEPEPVANVVTDPSPDLVYIIQRALAKKATDRYATASDMVTDLEVLYEELRTGSSSTKVIRSNGFRAPEDVAGALFATRSMVTLLVYAVVAWVIVKAVGWSVNRFVLSPHLVGLSLVALVSLVPTVWILAARNGARSRVWSLITGIGIPANIVVSVLVLLAVFAGRDIGAATETVAVQDETGQTIERVVPKNEFRQSIALYLPNNESGNSAYDWAEAGIGALVEIDLSQDHFLYLRSGFDDRAKQRLERAGFTRWSEAPWSLKRELAENANSDYLLTGSFTVESNEPARDPTSPGNVDVPENAIWELTFRIHNSRSGRLVGQKVYRGNDLFELVDEACVQLKRDIGVPEHHIETAQDLPVSAMVTASIPALAGFSKGIDLAVFRQDWMGSIGHLENAIEIDSTFAYAHCMLIDYYAVTNMAAKRDAAMKKTMRHLYKLPERVQFLAKASYYGYEQQPEKALGVLELMNELYPDDIQSRILLAGYRAERGERDLAIAHYNKALEIDPSRTEIHMTLGWIYRQKGDYDNAIAKYETYANEHPDDPEPYHAIGAAYELQGEFKRAREYYERALVIDPERATVLVELGDIHAKLHEDDRAFETWNRALEMSKTPQERARIYSSMRNFLSNRGRIEESIRHMKLGWAEEEKYMSPLGAQIDRLEDICLFVRGGRADEAFAEMESIGKEMASPYDGILPLGYMCIYVDLKDADKTEEALEELTVVIDTYQVEGFRGWIHWGRANVEELRGNYEAAIASYQKNLELNPTNVTMHRSIGRCYRKLGQYEKAIESLEKMLVMFPVNPTTHYEMALAYHGLGNQKKAQECLQKSLDVWKNADPVYEHARNARATAEEWGL